MVEFERTQTARLQMMPHEIATPNFRARCSVKPEAGAMRTDSTLNPAETTKSISSKYAKFRSLLSN
jgi:hypothetical protein